MEAPLATAGAGFADPVATLKPLGFEPTSGYRTQAHQDALRAQGLTSAKVSQHTLGNAIDFRVPKGMSKQEAIALARRQYPNAKISPTNGNSIHITFPDWGQAPDVSGSRRRYPD